jgi:intracellular sulfur oxidation DsrE/DsrF family protein
VRDVNVLLPLRLDDVVDAVAVHRNEVRFVVAKVGGAIGVLNREAEPARQLCECGYIGRVLKELSEVPLEFVVCGYKIEDRLTGLERWSGEWERLNGDGPFGQTQLGVPA